MSILVSKLVCLNNGTELKILYYSLLYFFIHKSYHARLIRSQFDNYDPGEMYYWN